MKSFGSTENGLYIREIIRHWGTDNTSKLVSVLGVFSLCFSKYMLLGSRAAAVEQLLMCVGGKCL